MNRFYSIVLFLISFVCSACSDTRSSFDHKQTDSTSTLPQSFQIKGRLTTPEGKGLSNTPIHIILGKRPPPSLAPNHHVRRLSHTIHTRVDGTYTYTLKRRGTFHFHLQLQPSYPYIPKKYVLEFRWPTQHVMDVPTLVYKEQTKQAVRTFFMKQFKMAPSELWKYQKQLDSIFKNLKLRR